jgi:hypothetical protein
LEGEGLKGFLLALSKKQTLNFTFLFAVALREAETLPRIFQKSEVL